MMNQTLGSRIAELRRKKNMTQEDLANALGVTPQECIFFDDSVKSCRSAKASGMTVIGVYDPFFEGTKDEMPLVCDRFIRDFGEML